MTITNEHGYDCLSCKEATQGTEGDSQRWVAHSIGGSYPDDNSNRINCHCGHEMVANWSDFDSDKDEFNNFKEGYSTGHNVTIPETILARTRFALDSVPSDIMPTYYGIDRLLNIKTVIGEALLIAAGNASFEPVSIDEGVLETARTLLNYSKDGNLADVKKALDETLCRTEKTQ